MRPFTYGALPSVIFSILSGLYPLLGQAGSPAKALFDAKSPTAIQQVQIHGPMASQFSTSITNGGLSVHVNAGPAAYPGLFIYPAGGIPWDLRSYGHVEARITNTGSLDLKLNLRVDNEGYGKPAWDMESKVIHPGQTQEIRVCFGYSNGFRPGYKLNQAIVKRVLFFTTRVTEEASFEVQSLTAAGSAGEKPVIESDTAPN